MGILTFIPIVTLLGGSLLCYLFARVYGKPRFTGLFSLLFLISVLVQILYLYPGAERVGFSLCGTQTFLEANGLAIFLGIVAVGLAMLVAIFDVTHMKHVSSLGRYYALILLMIAGAMGVGLAGDLFNLFVFFEVMSISSYVLVCFEMEAWEPVEAAVKYAIMTCFGSLLAVTGISLIFMYTGSLNLNALPETITAIPPMIAIASALLIIVGFGVKVGVTPLHMWLPDAYQAAPSGISALLSGMTAAAGLVAMIKALAALLPTDVQFGVVLIIFGIISMFWGNLVALVQTDLKRMLAYSSIAHMGYVLTAVGLAFSYLPTAGEYALRGGFFGYIRNSQLVKSS